MTNQELIDAALIALGVIESGDSADATDSATGLSELNNMMSAWAVSDKDLNWFTQDTLTDTAPLPDWSLDAVSSNLGIKCSIPFKTPVGADLAVSAMQGENLVARTLINLNLEGADLSHLSSGNHENIITGQ